MHTQRKSSKVYGSPYTAIATHCTSTGMPTQKLEPCEANPSGTGLITRRRTVQVPWIRSQNVQFHSNLILLDETRTVEHLFYQLLQVPIDVTAVFLVETWSLFNSLLNRSKVSERKHERVLSGNQTCNVLISRPLPTACTHSHKHTHCIHTTLHTHTHYTHSLVVNTLL